MVDSRLHKADVVAYDEENIGLLVGNCLFDGCLRLWLLLCLRLRGTCQKGQGGEDNTGGESAEDGVEITAHDRGPLSKRGFFLELSFKAGRTTRPELLYITRQTRHFDK